MKVLSLNNKGLTAVEILVCFVLMIILVVSMYSTVTTYKNKQSIESDRDKIVTYKNLLTKEIQDDLVKKGLVDAKINDETKLDSATRKYYEVELTFRDGTTKVLQVKADYASDFGNCFDSTEEYCKNDHDDVLEISYGTLGGSDYTTYSLPDLGYGYNGNNVATDATCSGNYHDGTYIPAEGLEVDGENYYQEGCKVYDFRINNVIISTDNNVFSFYVGFYHPDLGTRYGIDIVCPINYFFEQSIEPPELEFPTPEPEVKLCTVDSGTGLDVGDKITCGTESFNVISSDSTAGTVTMLAQYNLYDSGSGVLQDPQSATNTNLGAYPFSSNDFWSSITNGNISCDRITSLYRFGSTTYPSSVISYNLIRTYASNLSSNGLSVLDVRLINAEELVALGCNITSGTCSGAPSFVRNTAYWTGTSPCTVTVDPSNSSKCIFSFSVAQIYSVKSDGTFALNSYNKTYGVRPVITIPISSF